MPAKVKNARRSKTAKPQRRTPALPSPRTDADLRGEDRAPAARREPVVTMSRTDVPRSRMDAMEKAIAKEDAKIIAKASARALRRGLH
jgi:hypothetical protein